MSSAKPPLDQSRKFGFKETREQYEQRKKQEKQSKWAERLGKENLDKLQAELASLERARFLAPQQNERKRLVQRMIKDLEVGDENVATSETPVAEQAAPPADSDSDDELLFARGTATNDENIRLFVPRSIRRKAEEKAPEEEKKTVEQLAEEAEKELLAAAGSGDDLDAYLDSL